MNSLDGFTCGKYFIFNLAKSSANELKFGKHKELMVINILQYKYCAGKSRVMSSDHFS